MNAIKTTCQTQSCIAHLVRRGAMLIALLLAFMTEAWAKYYVIYYDDTSTTPATRHYLSISKDGTSVVDATNLSLRCYWETDGELISALGEKGVNQKNTTNNTTNQNNRKSLRSVAFNQKYITYETNGANESNIASGWVYNLSIEQIKQGKEPKFWLIDSEIGQAPILYLYYHKQYIYYEYGWKYSSAGYTSGTVAKMIAYDALPLMPPHIENITYTDDGISQVTLSAEEGCNIYYTTDGGDPITYGKKYEGPFSVNNSEAIIKTIAEKDNVKSSVAQYSLAVTLDDREDHSWTYYSGIKHDEDPSKDPSDENSGYNHKYKETLYSPNPCDVKITYNGNGGTISMYEYETAFVYYKTLESKKEIINGVSTNTYPYTVISNPFSVRPSTSSGDNKEYKGFGGWRVTKGKSYVRRRINGVLEEIPNSEDCILDLDEDIVFVGLSDNTDSPAQIVFEATWVPAQVTYLSNVKNDNTDYTFDVENNITDNVSTTYENNFLVINKGYSGNLTMSQPCTIMMVEPDGSADYRDYCNFTGSIAGSANNIKIEFTQWNPTTPIAQDEDKKNYVFINAMGRNFTIGRGMIMDDTERVLCGTKDTSPVNQILKVESGNFYKFKNYGATPSKIEKQRIIFGCDYDRAQGDNSKLEFEKKMCVAYSTALPNNLDDNSEICRVYSLSGSFVTGEDVGNAEHTSSYYFNVGGSASADKGYRYLEILGGEWKNIVGGWGPKHANDKPAFIFRMKGGHILGSIYGAAQYEAACGTCIFIITGGTINGWIAGGANGTKSEKGALDGESFIYIGGNAIIDSKPNSSEGSSTVINRAVGGNVFGAGCGYSASSTSGQVTLGTNVVIADNAYVERGVYGGGSYGYTEATSNIYITGGTIGGNAGGVNGTSYKEDIQGGVYGSACQNIGGNVNIFMTGGTVNGGLYGGSNASGTLSGNVKMTITGGTIGSSQTNASVYGGGYGAGTAVNGVVNMVLGNGNEALGATINGDVYGGSEKGVVTNNIDVTIHQATINGNVFGGGNQGVVNKNTTVTITGGTVTGNVYGGGNKASVEGETKVVIGSSKQ